MNPRLAWALPLFLSSCAAPPPPPEPPAEPPAAGGGRSLLHEAVGILSTRAIGASAVDWPAVEARLAPNIPAGDSPDSAHTAIRSAIASLGDPHARFMTPAEHLAWKDAQANPPPPPTEPPPNPAPAPAGRIPAWPEGSDASSDIAYLVIPGCGSGDPATLQSFALDLRRLILDSQARHPSGWMIDLRLNGGGNVWPMLLGLRPLLGDGICAMSTDASGPAKFGCDAESAWIDWPDGTRQVQLSVEPPPDDRIVPQRPIAVLIGGWTMSSGEVTAAALKGLPAARLFGEPTAGLTTVTNFFELSDGSVLILPVGAVASRDGIAIVGPISPDVPVESLAWPGPDDEAARAARAWIESHD